MTRGRKLTEDDAALLAVLSQGGLMEFNQLAMALGATQQTRRSLSRRVRKLRGLANDRGQTVSRVRQIERVREDFRCPVCRKGGVVGVTRSFSFQWGGAEFRYQHAVPKGEPSEKFRCAGPRMTIEEGRKLRRSEWAYALVAPEPELIDTVGTRVVGPPKLVYGLSDEGVQVLREWCADAGVTMQVRGSPDAEGWRFLEHAMATSEVYVRALVAMGCAGRPWDLPVRWEVEPGTLKWVPLVHGPAGTVEQGKFRYVKPDVTALVPAGGAAPRGRRVFIEVERGTQNLTDPNLENAGAVESKVKRYESFCCFAPMVEPVRSYYRRAFPDDGAEPCLVVVASEKRKKAILKALGSRESLTSAGFHGFRARVVSFEEVGGVLAELAGVTAQPVVPVADPKVVGRGKSVAAVEPPGMQLTLEEVAALGTGTLQMRQVYERLRERVRAWNGDLPEGAKPIPIEATPASWTDGARPIVERLLQVTADAEGRMRALGKGASN